MAGYFLRYFNKTLKKDLLICNTSDLTSISESLFEISKPNRGGVSFYHSPTIEDINKAELSFIFSCKCFANEEFNFIVARSSEMENKNKALVPVKKTMPTAYKKGPDLHYDLCGLNRSQSDDLFVVLVEELKKEYGHVVLSDDALYRVICDAISNDEVDFNYYKKSKITALSELDSICSKNNVKCRKLKNRLSQLLKETSNSYNQLVCQIDNDVSGWESE